MSRKNQPNLQLQLHYEWECISTVFLWKPKNTGMLICKSVYLCRKPASLSTHTHTHTHTHTPPIRSADIGRKGAMPLGDCKGPTLSHSSGACVSRRKFLAGREIPQWTCPWSASRTWVSRSSGSTCAGRLRGCALCTLWRCTFWEHFRQALDE
jgi:hypothetical protein